MKCSIKGNKIKNIKKMIVYAYAYISFIKFISYEQFGTLII